MASYLEMLFRNQAGQLVTISVIDPRSDITAGEVETVMDTIIAQNILNAIPEIVRIDSPIRVKPLVCFKEIAQITSNNAAMNKQTQAILLPFY